MRFIPFLDKIPEQNESLLGKVLGMDKEWHNIVFVYWGTYHNEHQIEDNHGAFLNPKDVVYLCEEEVEEYEAEEIEEETSIAHVFGNIKL